tara:strand:- start:456 stop:665 length:210 start_codon:yes stop_codon:yes gene_type:complete
MGQLKKRVSCGSAPHPRLALLFIESINVEDGLPRGVGLAVLLQRAPPPDAAHVRLVLPEVVVEAVEHTA